jgi:hypothetical protein
MQTLRQNKELHQIEQVEQKVPWRKVIMTRRKGLKFLTARYTIDFNLINTYYVFNITRSVLEVDLHNCVTDLITRTEALCQ